MIVAAAMLAGCKTEPTGIAVKYISHTISGAGGMTSFTVYPGAVQDWSILFPPGFEAYWLDFSAMSGKGETTVIAIVGPNTDLLERAVTVIVTAGDHNVPIIITQEAVDFTFEVSPEMLTDLPDNEGGFSFIKRDLEVTTDISWYAEIVQTEPTAQPWVQFFFDPDLMPTYGSMYEPINGDATVELAIQFYSPPGSPVREATVCFYHDLSGLLLKEVPVSQLSQ